MNTEDSESKSEVEDQSAKKSIFKNVHGLAGMNYQTEKHYKLQIKKLKQENKELKDQITKSKKK